jgi:AcrR family transcriptional regulator
MKHRSQYNAPVEERNRLETKTRILDVAEQLFAKRGLAAVSVRDITQAAKANLGAINYHFGTKKRLIAAIFDRRLTPVNQERLNSLDAAVKAAGDTPPKLEAVLEAFIRPAVRRAFDQKLGGITFGKLMGRCLMEPNPELEALLHAHFEPIARRFDAELLRAAPKFTREEIFWRMHLTVGTLHHALMLLDRVPPGRPKVSQDFETYVQRLVAFAAAGFRASVPVKRRSS